MGDGPSLETYIETRLNLLGQVVEERGQRSEQSLAAFIDSTRVAAIALRAAADAERAATDLRYQQRFEAQSDALAAAFLSQQTAMQTALAAAKEAVVAALAAADRAVSKAELAADKRFEALNELRSMLTDMVGTLMSKAEALQRFGALAEKIDAHAARTDTLEARFNVLSGQLAARGEGGKESVEATRSNRTFIIMIVSGLVGLVGLGLVLWARSHP